MRNLIPILLVVCFALQVQAKQRKVSNLELALAVARVAAHEGAFQNTRDLDLVWQVVQNNGDDNDKRLGWLERHSPRALGLVTPRVTDANTWSAELDWTATVPASVAGGKDNYYWRVIVVPRWLSLLERSRRLVDGEVYEKPCAVEPITWGGKMDHARAAAHGRYPIGCTGTLNDGFATADALRASGRTL